MRLRDDPDIFGQDNLSLTLTVYECFGKLSGLRLEEALNRGGLGLKECLLGLPFFVQLTHCVVNRLGHRDGPGRCGKTNAEG